jgi:hypothetical protein
MNAPAWCPSAPSAATRHGQARTLVISWVESASDTATRDTGVEPVLKAIRGGGKNLRGQIEQIRNRFEAELAMKGGDRKAARLARSTVPTGSRPTCSTRATRLLLASHGT